MSFLEPKHFMISPQPSVCFFFSFRGRFLPLFGFPNFGGRENCPKIPFFFSKKNFSSLFYKNPKMKKKTAAPTPFFGIKAQLVMSINGIKSGTNRGFSLHQKAKPSSFGEESLFCYRNKLR